MQIASTFTVPLPDGELERLEACVREPIHVPGAVQPHGALLVVDPETLRIRQASANALDLLAPAAPRDDMPNVLARGLAEFCPADVVDELRRVLDGDPTAANPVEAILAGQTFDVFAHRSGSHAVVEFEPVDGAADEASVQAIYAATRRLSRTSSIDELYAALARELGTLSGYDQVLVYRFHPDGHGEVVAEARAEGMEPFLGLHFPASDIPAQARRLYLTKLSRVIATSDYEPVPIEADPAAMGVDEGGDDPVDLSLAELRSVSPHHLQFMRNMGQGATLSFSLIAGGELIGMITCAHRTPRRVRYLHRQGYEILASQVALQLAAMAEIQRLRDQEEIRVIRERLSEAVAGREDVAAALLGADGPTMLDLVPADAAAVFAGGRLTVAGAGPLPDERAVRRAIALLADGRDRAVVTDALVEARPDVAAALSDVAGLLALPFGGDGQYLLWFRREIVQTLNWMGDMSPSNRLTPLSPRNSFSMWAESVTGRSLPWRGRDAAARDLARDVEAGLLRRVESQLSHLGLHDALTDLPNRRLLLERLEDMLSGPSGSVALLFIDLDGFKAINDSLGHEAGDELLIQAAGRIVTSTRGNDTVARLGGDEFVVLCEHADPATASVIAERVRSELQAPFTVRGTSVAVTASVGIASAAPGRRAAELLDQADAAMYRAKRAGRNRVVEA